MNTYIIIKPIYSFIAPFIKAKIHTPIISDVHKLKMSVKYQHIFSTNCRQSTPSLYVCEITLMHIVYMFMPEKAAALLAMQKIVCKLSASC